MERKENKHFFLNSARKYFVPVWSKLFLVSLLTDSSTAQHSSGHVKDFSEKAAGPQTM